MAEAIRWAVAEGARVIDVSLGAEVWKDESPAQVEAACREAVERGAVIVAAAGPEGKAPLAAPPVSPPASFLHALPSSFSPDIPPSPAGPSPSPRGHRPVLDDAIFDRRRAMRQRASHLPRERVLSPRLHRRDVALPISWISFRFTSAPLAPAGGWLGSPPPLDDAFDRRPRERARGRSISFREDAPLFRAEMISSGDDAPSFRAETTSLGDDAPSFRAETTSSGNDAPSFRAETTSLGDDAPSFRAETTSSGDDASLFRAETTSSGDETPSFRAEMSSSCADAPSFRAEMDPWCPEAPSSCAETISSWPDRHGGTRGPEKKKRGR